jgi:hypothetical protein
VVIGGVPELTHLGAFASGPAGADKRSDACTSSAPKRK